MDNEFYHSYESPNFELHDFLRSNELSIDCLCDDRPSWSNQQSRDNSCFANLQPSSSSQVCCNDLCSDSIASFDAQQQLGNVINNESNVEGLSDSSVNCPDVDDIIFDGIDQYRSYTTDNTNGQQTQSTSNDSNVSFDPVLVLEESSIDIAELDRYLNAPEKTDSSSDSLFGSIIREDQFENSTTVQLDHAYDVPSTSEQVVSTDLVRHLLFG